MPFDKGLGRRQAQATPFALAIEGAAGLTEFRQGPWNVFGRDANSCIGNLEHDAAVRSAPELECGLAARPSELNRVGQQVQRNLCQFASIGIEGRQLVLRAIRQTDAEYSECPRLR